jgi:hypothetical protein
MRPGPGARPARACATEYARLHTFPGSNSRDSSTSGDGLLLSTVSSTGHWKGNRGSALQRAWSQSSVGSASPHPPGLRQGAHYPVVSRNSSARQSVLRAASRVLDAYSRDHLAHRSPRRATESALHLSIGVQKRPTIVVQDIRLHGLLKATVRVRPRRAVPSGGPIQFVHVRAL